MALLINGSIFYEEKLSHLEMNLALQASIPLDKVQEKSFLDLSGYSDLNAHYSSQSTQYFSYKGKIFVPSRRNNNPRLDTSASGLLNTVHFDSNTSAAH